MELPMKKVSKTVPAKTGVVKERDARKERNVGFRMATPLLKN